MNQILLERTPCMLSNVGLTKMFWAGAINTSCYLINHGPHTGINMKIPNELWHGKYVDYSNLRVFWFHGLLSCQWGEVGANSKEMSICRLLGWCERI